MLLTEFNFYKVDFISPASPLMYGIIELHDHIFFFLNMILFIVLFLIATTVNYFSYFQNTKLNKYLLSQSVQNKYDWLRLNHGTTIEIVWTVIPSLILVLIAIPSFALLYATDELVDPAVTIQVIGHQWYWSYEYNDLVVLDFDTLKVSNKFNDYISKKFILLVAALSPDLHPEFDIPAVWVKILNLKSNSGWFINYLNATEFYKGLNITSSEWNVYLSSDIDPYNFKKEAFKKLNLRSTSKLLAFSGDNTILFSDFLNNINFSKLDFDFISKLVTKSNSVVIKKAIHGNFEFDSYLKSEDDLKLGEQRLYETDFPLVLPKNTHIRFMITSDDVIHSWSVPALGIKVDAVPGRINHAHTFIKRSGIFYGQCSELCGVNHAFMPIQIIAFEPNMYYNYLRLILLSK